MRLLGGSLCDRHRDDLLGFADHRDPSAVDVASLEHLDRCDACRREVEETALAVVALRRIGAETREAKSPVDGWAALRRRVLARPAPWRWRAPLAGLLASAALVALVLAPAAYFRPPAPYIQEVGTDSSIFDALRAVEDRSEVVVLQQQLAARTVPVVEAQPAQAVSIDATWFGPDGLWATHPDSDARATVIVRHE